MGKQAAEFLPYSESRCHYRADPPPYDTNEQQPAIRRLVTGPLSKYVTLSRK